MRHGVQVRSRLITCGILPACLALCPATAQEPAGQAAEWPDFAVMPDAETRVGRRKAGMLCLPDGRFRVRNFVGDAASFRVVFLSRLDSSRMAAIARLDRVVLSGMKVSLCDRNYLMGSSGTFSGKARFDFELAWDDGTIAVHNVELAVPKAERAGPSTIFERAVTRLIEQLDPPGEAGA